MNTLNRPLNYSQRRRAAAEAAAIAAGRDPRQRGQPSKFTEEERREKRRLKARKWREANLERSREITRDSMKRAAATKAIAAGREPGKKGRAPIFTEEEKRAKRAAKQRKFYAANPAVLEKAKAGDLAAARLLLDRCLRSRFC